MRGGQGSIAKIYNPKTNDLYNSTPADAKKQVLNSTDPDATETLQEVSELEINI
jgi:hypothetical protein